HYTDHFDFVNKKSCSSTDLPLTARHERASSADFINVEIPDPQLATRNLYPVKFFAEKECSEFDRGATRNSQLATRNP
ncbi:MAG: hypothetical protein WBD61_00840, partial [Desulfobulbales bacterium]